MEGKDKIRKLEKNIREEQIASRFLDGLKPSEKLSTAKESAGKEERKEENSAQKPSVPAAYVFTTGASSDIGTMKVQAVASEDDGEIVDPRVTLMEECCKTNKCAELEEVLNQCNDRVNSKQNTRETCEQELYDFVGSVAACVSKHLFSKLK